jgi:hypothetical protein
VTWEEGTWAAWRYDLLHPQATQVLVCDPRRHALLKEGNKSDKIDARKLADLLRTGMLRPVYHEEHGLRFWQLGFQYRSSAPQTGFQYCAVDSITTSSTSCSINHAASDRSCSGLLPYRIRSNW